MQANVIQTAGQATTNATNAEALRQKQESGGANVLPTGANEALNAEILAKGQQSEATGLQQEKVAGYEQGVKNLEGGTQAELGIADATNPAKSAEAALGAGSLAETAGAEQFKENQETGPMAIFSGITGGLKNLAGAAEGFAGSGLIPGGSDSSGGLNNLIYSGGASPTGTPGDVFHKGGIVPGKPGEEKWIKVLAGERIIPVSKSKRKKSIVSQVLAKD